MSGRDSHFEGMEWYTIQTELENHSYCQDMGAPEEAKVVVTQVSSADATYRNFHWTSAILKRNIFSEKEI